MGFSNISEGSLGIALHEQSSFVIRNSILFLTFSRVPSAWRCMTNIEVHMELQWFFNMSEVALGIAMHDKC